MLDQLKRKSRPHSPSVVVSAESFSLRNREKEEKRNDEKKKKMIREEGRGRTYTGVE